ncbi:hypothetical protein ABKV19_006839 [Rosa sericea]
MTTPDHSPLSTLHSPLSTLQSLFCSSSNSSLRFLVVLVALSDMGRFEDLTEAPDGQARISSGTSNLNPLLKIR